jgi:4-oxalocrotonate tautomerase family enzyme
MPRLIVQSLEGRSVELKRELARRLNEVVVDVYKVDPQTVTIYIEEVPPENFARGGQLALDRDRPVAAREDG